MFSRVFFFFKQYFHDRTITSRSTEMQSQSIVEKSKHQSCDKMFWISEEPLSKIDSEALLVYPVVLLLFRIMSLNILVIIKSNSQPIGKMISWSTNMNTTASHSPFLYPERVGLLFHKAVLKKSHCLFLHKQ